MTWYFGPPREPDRPRNGDDSAGGLSDLPAALLQRHGARVLHPPKAAVFRGSPVPRPTVYRAKTLLIPGDLLEDEDTVAAINAALAAIGLILAVPPREDHVPPGSELLRLPRTVVLVPLRPEDGASPRAVTVDAWEALQTLRAAAIPRPRRPGLVRRRRRLPLYEDVVSRFALEHLLIGSAIGLAGDGDGISGSPAHHGHGITGPGSTDSYLFAGGDSRTPVAVCIEAPAREPLADCEARYGRRPVIMVMDSGPRAHQWLDVQPDPAPDTYHTIPDGFVAIDAAMQQTIHDQGERARNAGDRPRQLIDGPWDRPPTDEPLVGELTTHIGHLVFIAGIVRQVVPAAQVLSIRIMHSDGVVYEGDLICALKLLEARVAAATGKHGDMTKMVDVLSLSLGYFSETPADADYTSGLWNVIDHLLGMGVVVTASAGNYATSRRCYPAAFADRAPTEDPSAPLISVGALNPNTSQALFSDGGSWVRAWATGAAMVSTFPVDLNGSQEPAVRLPAHLADPIPPGMAVLHRREALKPDDYSGGFALWSGTSFSAPLVAAHLARALLRGAAGARRLRLDQRGTDAAVRRIEHALRDLGWYR